MFKIVLATSRSQAWQRFTAALSQEPDVQVKLSASGAAALEAVQASAPHLVVIDAGLPDASPLDLVRKLLLVNAMVNTAVVSPLDEAEFHEASEGLGVLSRLPQEPGPGEAGELLQKLKAILGGMT
jgi:DNA-binding NarL/FixJ family response regulator